MPSALKNCTDRLLYWRELALDDVPHDLRIHSEVFVDQDVAQPGNAFPFDLRPLRADGFWNFFAASPMISRLRTTASNVLGSLANSFALIAEVYRWILRAASRMSSR